MSTPPSPIVAPATGRLGVLKRPIDQVRAGQVGTAQVGILKDAVRQVRAAKVGR